jgi:hypothetical protein
MTKYHLLTPKPPSTPRPVTRVLHRGHVASEHFPPEHQIIALTEYLHPPPVLHAHTAHLRFPTRFLFTHTQHFGTYSLTFWFTRTPIFRTTDPSCCLPAKNSVLPHRPNVFPGREGLRSAMLKPRFTCPPRLRYHCVPSCAFARGSLFPPYRYVTWR